MGCNKGSLARTQTVAVIVFTCYSSYTLDYQRPPQSFILTFSSLLSLSDHNFSVLVHSHHSVEPFFLATAGSNLDGKHSGNLEVGGQIGWAKHDSK